MGVNEKADAFGPVGAVQLGVRRERNRQLIADTANVEQQTVGTGVENLAAQIADHRDSLQPG